jgi:hypothetical protein
MNDIPISDLTLQANIDNFPPATNPKAVTLDLAPVRSVEETLAVLNEKLSALHAAGFEIYLDSSCSRSDRPATVKARVHWVALEKEVEC